MSTVSAVCLAEAQLLSNVATALYSAPTSPSTTAIIDKFTVTNTDSSSHQVTVYIVPNGGSPQTSNILISQLTVNANTCTDLTALLHVLAPGDSVQAFAETASVVVARISGRQIQ